MLAFALNIIFIINILVTSRQCVKYPVSMIIENEIVYFYDDTLLSGEFSCLEIEFNLQRKVGYYIIKIYIPSILLVMISWVSFWIELKESTCRISLTMVCVLSTVILAVGAIQGLPEARFY